MIPRYTPADIGAIFSDESRLQKWLDIEILVVEAWSRLGRVPDSAVPALRHLRPQIKRMAELEEEQGHDVAAFVSSLQESAGEEGRYIHLGLTSSDLVDTALAVQMRDAAQIITIDCAALEAALADRARQHRLTVMPGRTHGVHAEPVTLGVKMANHLDELRRARGRFHAARDEIAVGQISGAVGTHATVPPEIEEHVCRGLGLAIAPATTQVIARDRHAAYITAIALMGAVLERLAVVIRLLQITEVDEAAEPFSETQKGSSSMPHKRNPVLCERICGMARTLRGYAATAMENVALWHERDISHSSAERIIIPDASALIVSMLRLARTVVEKLVVNSDKMRADVDHLGGIIFSQRLLTALIADAGWPREKAYRLVQSLAAAARETGGDFHRLVAASPEVTRALNSETIEKCFDIDSYLEHIDVTFQRLGLNTGTTQVAAAAATRGS